MNKSLTIVLSGIMMISLFSCGQNKTNRILTNPDKKEKNKAILTIDTFSDFPEEIIGCSCYFSNDSTEFKKDKYIYVNDFGQTSFLKINGVMIKFTQTDFEEIGETKTIAKSKSNDYELTVEINAGHESGYGTSKHTGTIKLTDKKGNSITRKFYGLCGC